MPEYLSETSFLPGIEIELGIPEAIGFDLERFR